MTRPVGNSEQTAPEKKRLGGVTGKGFMPGQCGNPSGRPKSASLSKAYRQKLESLFPGDPAGRTYAEVIADRVADDAANGNLNAARELADRAEGRAAQKMSLDVNHGVNEQFGKMTPEELETYASTGALPAWFKPPEDGRGTEEAN
jgi:Family of unknown function (DUF5681)